MRRRGSTLGRPSRRVMLAAIATMGFATPIELRAQSPPLMLRVGAVGLQPREAPIYTAFETRMAELGYIEVKNFAFEYVRAASIEDYPAGYAQLAARQIDLILCAGSEPALRAARAVADARPIVLIAIDFDPVAKGYVASFARPGNNITGIAVRQLELAAKRVELLRETLPRAQRLGLLFDMASRDQAEASAAAAPSLNFVPRLIEIAGQPPDYAAAFGMMDDAPGEPVILPASPMFLRDRAAIEQLLIGQRVPAIAAFRENAEAGALISYGVDLIGLFHDIADFVDRVAKGAHPADLPMEPPTHFHMAANLKTAASLGVVIPQFLLARADEVIE